MIANIRVLNEGNFEFLCELDIMKYSRDQILERMKERGIEKDNFFICGISDWQVDKIMSLDEFYSHLVLKKHSKHSKIFGTSLNKSVTFFFKTAQACSMGFKSGE